MIPAGRFAAVVAVTREWGIGNEGQLPWHPRRLHLDMGFLRHITLNGYELIEDGGVRLGEAKRKNAVIMGRKTWESIPPRFRPMEGRHNIVITSNPGDFDCRGSQDVCAVSSFDSACEKALQLTAPSDGQVFILGGGGIYDMALIDPRCEAVFITRFTEHPPLPCTVFFPSERLQAYTKIFNVTDKVDKALRSSLPKSAKIDLHSDDRKVTEGDITYQFELHARY